MCLFLLRVIAESPGLSQETWVPTMFKTKHKSRLLGDTSQTFQTFAQSGSNSWPSLGCPCTHLCPCACWTMLPYLPLWLPFLPDGVLLELEGQNLCLTDSSAPPRAWPRIHSQDWQWLRTWPSGYRDIVSYLNFAT